MCARVGGVSETNSLLHGVPCVGWRCEAWLVCVVVVQAMVFERVGGGNITGRGGVHG